MCDPEVCWTVTRRGALLRLVVTGVRRLSLSAPAAAAAAASCFRFFFCGVTSSSASPRLPHLPTPSCSHKLTHVHPQLSPFNPTMTMHLEEHKTGPARGLADVSGTCTRPGRCMRAPARGSAQQRCLGGFVVGRAVAMAAASPPLPAAECPLLVAPRLHVDLIDAVRRQRQRRLLLLLRAGPRRLPCAMVGRLLSCGWRPEDA
jgi:hypothetical protein